jgi:pSer/pThr/pTyr-binding forkhead associated (FHA) protein
VQLERTGVAEQAWLVMQGVSPSLWAERVLAKRQTMGRSSECDVRVVHKTVSRRHAEIWRRDGSLFIRDLDSSNGTFVNGRRVVEAIFSVGGTIQLGEVSLKVVESNTVDLTEGEDETELLAKSPDVACGLLEKLSPGQIQVVSLLLRGLGEKEVAERLCLSKHTVHTHVKHIYKLLDVQSRSQLMAQYLGRPED